MTAAQTTRASDLTSRWRSLVAASPASVLFAALARRLLEAGDAPGAIEVCQVGLAVQPGHAEGARVLDEALAASVRVAPEVPPTSVRPGAPDESDPFETATMADLLVAQGHLGEAVALLQRLVARTPDDVALNQRLVEVSQRWQR